MTIEPVEMSIKIVKDRGGYLSVTIGGDFIITDLKRCIDDIGETAQGSAISKVLVDLKDLPIPSPADEYAVARYVPLAWGTRLKAAFIGRHKAEFILPEKVAKLGWECCRVLSP